MYGAHQFQFCVKPRHRTIVAVSMRDTVKKAAHFRTRDSTHIGWLKERPCFCLTLSSTSRGFDSVMVTEVFGWAVSHSGLLAASSWPKGSRISTETARAACADAVTGEKSFRRGARPPFLCGDRLWKFFVFLLFLIKQWNNSSCVLLT